MGLSIAEIAQVLHVTPRSVRRYLGHLRVTTPIEAVPSAPGRENVWRIKPSERARSVPLRRAPAYCLLATRGIFDPLKGSALFDALDLVHRQMLQVASRPSKGPMEGEIRGDARLDERLLFVSSPPASYAARAEEIDDLFRAVADLHVVRFRLQPQETGGRAEAVVAHPYAVYLRAGALQIVAFDVERAEVRALPFDRLAGLVLSAEERFVVPADFRASDLVHGIFGEIRAPGPARVRLLLVEFDPRAADEIRRAGSSTQRKKIATAPDGRVRLSVQLPAALLPEARRWSPRLRRRRARDRARRAGGRRRARALVGRRQTLRVTCSASSAFHGTRRDCATTPAVGEGDANTHGNQPAQSHPERR